MNAGAAGGGGDDDVATAKSQQHNLAGSNSLTCDYLVAADGSNSFVRRQLGIELQGTDQLQTLINVHFTCPGLRNRLIPRPAMLYFVFNETCVAVLVAHDPLRDEWVCQLPIFPPFQTLHDYDKPTLQGMLEKILGVTSSSTSSSTSSTSSTTTRGAQMSSGGMIGKIKILSVNTWTMHAQVAQAFSATVDVGKEAKGGGGGGGGGGEKMSIPRVFLIGDAAHRFPPAGGFGMNTGLQDAHNLAWKLSLVASGVAKPSLLHTYNTERLPVAKNITALSVKNYEKSAKTARLLGVDPILAKLAVKAGESLPLPSSLRTSAVKTALKTGLSTLKWLGEPGNPLGDVRVRALQSQVQRGESLPLVFPSEDIDFEYNAGALVSAVEKVNSSDSSNIHFSASSSSSSSSSSTSSAMYTPPRLRVGARIPHCWLGVERCGGPGTQPLISTLDIAAWIDSSLSQKHRYHHPFACVLLVDAASAPSWKALIQNLITSSSSSFSSSSSSSSSSCATSSQLSTFCVIGVKANVNGGVDTDSTSSSYHQYLQGLHQQPPFPDRFVNTDMKKTINVSSPPLWNHNHNDDAIEGPKGDETLVDVTGKLLRCIKLHLQSQKSENGEDRDLRFAIAIRPDGHVCATQTHLRNANDNGSTQKKFDTENSTKLVYDMCLALSI